MVEDKVPRRIKVTEALWIHNGCQAAHDQSAHELNERAI